MSIIVKSAVKLGDKKPLVLGESTNSVPFIPIDPIVMPKSEDAPEEMLEEDVLKEIDMEEDAFSDLLTDDSDSSKVLDFILAELASEIHVLKAERVKRFNANMSTTQISARRIDALKKAGDLWFKKKDLNKNTSIDVKSPEFQLILTSFLGKVKETMDESDFNREMVQVFFTRLSHNLKTWEEEISKITLEKRVDTITDTNIDTENDL